MSGWKPGEEPDIADLAFLADRHGAALVDADGSVAWLCLPRLDRGSICAKLLDAQRGGHVTIAPRDGGEATAARSYLDESLVLETVWTTNTGRARVRDLLAVDADDPARAPSTLLRICDGLEGEVELEVIVEGCFDYGAARPWIRPAGGDPDAFRLTAGDDGILLWSDGGLEQDGDHGLLGTVRLRKDDRWRLALRYVIPTNLDTGDFDPLDAGVVDRAVEDTVGYWRDWSESLGPPSDCDPEGIALSARVLHGLTNGRTGAIAAAASMALPESAEGRTWDYRASWVRDSVFAVRALAEVGDGEEADAFHRFVLRTAAGNAGEVRVVYGMGGERRLPEFEIPELRGWRGIGPVRVGNNAASQDQHDVLGEFLNLAYRHHVRGWDVDEADWRFLCGLADRAAEVWPQRDNGIWEWRGDGKHFVHSKALCWSALDRGLRLAEKTGFDAPADAWRSAREAIARAIDEQGTVDGVFVQAFGADDLDAAALLLPVAGFCAWDDPRMVATADAIMEGLNDGGLLRRYLVDDGQPGKEHAFVACTFWLVECLARQGRREAALPWFERAIAARTELGLFSEQADARTGALWGNFPQALTHLSHIAAGRAIDGAPEPGRED